MSEQTPGERRSKADMDALPKLAGWVFKGFGTLLALGGIVMTFDDPAGLAVLAFGLVFVGAGFLVGKLFTAPAGKRSVAVGSYEVDISNHDGTRGTRTAAGIIHVDENATEAEIEQARKNWLREQWQRRPDWVAGRVIAEDERSGDWLTITAVVWCVFTALALGAALIWGDFAWLVTAGAALFTAGVGVSAVRRRLRRARFGASVCQLRQTPALLGSELRGEVETGVARSQHLPDGFRLRLRCAHRREEVDRSGPGNSRRTRYHYDVLWEAEQRHPGATGGDARHYRVPVRFALPDDQPPASLDGGSEGIVWELTVSAVMPGIDYQAEFRLPVLPPGAEWLGQETRAQGDG